MNWLVPLSAAQTLLLAFTASQMFALQAQTDDLAETTESLRIAMSARPAQSASLPAGVFGAADSLSGDEIRDILRAELAARPAATGAPAAAAAPAAPRADPAQIKRAIAEIDADIARASHGRPVTPGELDQIGAKIAELPADERQAAFLRLTRAVNSGELNAVF